MLTGTRVALDSIVYPFRYGESAESIANAFPVLKLEQVYGAITFYLANQKTIDDYLQQGQQEAQELRAKLMATDPQFYQRFRDARLSQAVGR